MDNNNAAHTTTDDKVSSDIVRLLELEHHYMKKRLYCMKCCKEKIGCINLPCSHVVFCQTCGDLESRCIFCNKVINAIANIYTV